MRLKSYRIRRILSKQMRENHWPILQIIHYRTVMSTTAQIVGRMQKRPQIKIITQEIHYEIVHRLSVLMRIKFKIK
jgi:hypothetical protein